MTMIVEGSEGGTTILSLYILIYIYLICDWCRRWMMIYIVPTWDSLPSSFPTKYLSGWLHQSIETFATIILPQFAPSIEVTCMCGRHSMHPIIWVYLYILYTNTIACPDNTLLLCKVMGKNIKRIGLLFIALDVDIELNMYLISFAHHYHETRMCWGLRSHFTIVMNSIIFSELIPHNQYLIIIIITMK